MKFAASSLINLRFIFLLVSLAFIALSLLGPPNVNIHHLLSSLDFTSLMSLYKTNDSFFRMPDSTNRFFVFILGIISLFISAYFTSRTRKNNEIFNNLTYVLFGLFFTSILLTDYFYNVVALLLLAVAVYYFIYYARNEFSNLEKALLIVYFLLFLLPFVHSLYIPTVIKEIDNYTRFILAIPIYIMLRELNLSQKNILYIINISALILGPIAIFFFINETARVRGYTSTATIFGNISLLLSVLSIISIKYCRAHNISLLFPYIASLSSFFSWGMTGSRGSIFFALTMLLLLILVSDIRKSLRISINIKSIIFILTMSLIFLSSQSFQRFGEIYSNIQSYSENKESHTWKHQNSIIPRLIIWEGSIDIISDNLLLGVGLDNFNQELEQRIINKKIPAIRKDFDNLTGGLNHAHNQYLDIFAKTGIIGFLILLLFIIVNITFFLSYWAKDKNNIFSLFGIITITMYSGFMLNHVILSHQQSTLFMVLTLTFFSGLSRSFNRRGS